jgi:hypothetical protein
LPLEPPHWRAGTGAGLLLLEDQLAQLGAHLLRRWGIVVGEDGDGVGQVEIDVELAVDAGEPPPWLTMVWFLTFSTKKP